MILGQRDHNAIQYLFKYCIAFWSRCPRVNGVRVGLLNGTGAARIPVFSWLVYGHCTTMVCSCPWKHGAECCYTALATVLLINFRCHKTITIHADCVFARTQCQTLHSNSHVPESRHSFWPSASLLACFSATLNVTFPVQSIAETYLLEP